MIWKGSHSKTSVRKLKVAEKSTCRKIQLYGNWSKRSVAIENNYAFLIFFYHFNVVWKLVLVCLSTCTLACMPACCILACKLPCILVFMLQCSPGCLLASVVFMPQCSFGCLLARLLTCMFASILPCILPWMLVFVLQCLLACLLAFLLACLLTSLFLCFDACLFSRFNARLDACLHAFCECLFASPLLASLHLCFCVLMLAWMLVFRACFHSRLHAWFHVLMLTWMFACMLASILACTRCKCLVFNVNV